MRKLNFISRLEEFFSDSAPPEFVTLEISDIEAIEETKEFRGKPWNDLPCEIWWNFERSVFFFNDDSIIYYLPSLMKCSVVNFEMCHLAVSNTFFVFLRARDRHNLVSKLSEKHLFFIIEWLNEIKDKCLHYQAIDFSSMVSLIEAEKGKR